MPAPGFFEIYPSARPPLPAGVYTVAADLQLTAAPPHGEDGHIPVDGAEFNVHIDAPRYSLPPDQVLSTFPPAGSQGDWRERLPQIVLKRRTLPWERNPDPAADFDTSPPWLALVVLAEGEGHLSPDVNVTECVTPGVDLGTDGDVPKGKYLEVGANVVEAVFPCLDELHLLAHVRKVDLSDTELAMGDDDGYLAVVLSNRMPQPAPPTVAGGDPTPLKYTAYLINLEGQLDELLATEPEPALSFDTTLLTTLVQPELLRKPPNAPIDQVAMGLANVERFGKKGPGAAHAVSEQVAPFSTAAGIEEAASGWATGPVSRAATTSDDLSPVRAWKTGASAADFGVLPFLRTLRFPVLLSWDFTCTGEGGFERLINTLDVGLLGTIDEAQPPPVPEVAPTGHVALAHRTRRGEEARSWYRGPLVPQPTARTGPVGGVLPLAHTGDQLRKVVPDGREDVSLASAFEIGRLLTYSKPGIVAALMDWRRELFGAARARSVADLFAGLALADIGLGVAGGRTSLEDLVRKHLVMTMADMPPDRLGPRARDVAQSRVPDALVDVADNMVRAGLGVDTQVPEAPSAPVSADERSLTMLRAALADRVDRLATSALKLDQAIPHGRSRRRRDTLDDVIARAEKDGG